MMPAALALLFAQVPLAGHASTAGTAVASDDLPVVPHGLRLITESLRVPFGDDWGGEMRGALDLGGGLSFGAFVKVWSEGVCDPHWCRDRSIHTGVGAQLRVTPALDLNLNYEVGKGPATGRGGMLRARWKF